MPNIYSALKKKSPCYLLNNKGTVVDSGQEFGRHLGKREGRLKYSTHGPPSSGFRLSQQKELKQRGGGGDGNGQNTYTS